MQLNFTLLNEHTGVEGFDCGNHELNAFLKNLALLFQHRHFGVTITCFSAKELIGYYTLCPACIQREELPEKMMTGPRPNPIPGFRICRLAIDKEHQGKGYGKILFVHALKKCLDQAEQIGGSVVIIDAKDEEARQFYEHFGFISVSNKAQIVVQTIKYIRRHF
jgi:GNAT superfamily N-acetyltransferase